MKAGVVLVSSAALAVVGVAAAAGHPRATLGGLRPHRVHSFVPLRAGAGSQTYTDRVGDAVLGAPDISGITVANDDEGNISMVVTLVDHPSDFQPNEGFLVALDTDGNVNTGNGGFDYVYAGVKDHTGLFVWNGSTFAVAKPTTLQMTSPTSFRINRSDLGYTKSIAFFVETTRDNGDSVGDDAPDGVGVFTYKLVLPGTAPPPTTTTTTTPPAPRFAVAAVGVPHAGRRFVVRARIVIGSRSASPSALGCAARIGTSPLKTAALKGRAPYRACVITIPIRTAGKKLTVTLVMQYRSMGATRRVGYTIRA
jgi:hypothetical protein